jgi:hypothetical protein
MKNIITKFDEFINEDFSSKQEKLDKQEDRISDIKYRKNELEPNTKDIISEINYKDLISVELDEKKYKRVYKIKIPFGDVVLTVKYNLLGKVDETILSYKYETEPTVFKDKEVKISIYTGEYIDNMLYKLINK